MGLFNAFASADSTSSGLTVSELAQQTKADPLLVTRLMRTLTDGELFAEISQDRYAALPLAKHFADGSIAVAAFKHFEIDTEVVSKLPAYLRETGYVSPTDAHDGPLQYTIGTKQHYFDWLSQHPQCQEAFNTVMQLNFRNRGAEWFDLYPVQDRLNSVDASQALIVDIGGGVGHDLRAFAARHGALKGRLILQDLDSVVSAIPTESPLPSNTEAMAHDFFKPQPIRGASAYYMRTVLHDWPDKEAKIILRNTAEAMGPHSVLLISEKVMPLVNAPASLVQADISMMLQFASLERTRDQWVGLIQRSGLLEVTGVWEPEDVAQGARSLFEARLKQD